MKRFLDIIVSFFGLVSISPVLLVFIYLVYRHDKHSPFYIATRIGINGSEFKMFKLRSMSINADKSGVDSTSADDQRITPIGHKIRKYKLDEVTQLVNVLIGDMSLVGPRPNVKADTDLYTSVERGLLEVKPGITDFSSIVFSDEGDILAGKDDPDLSYNQLIRPWKSRLGLIYIEKRSMFLDMQIIYFTIVALLSKPRALVWVGNILTKLEVEPDIVATVKRNSPLSPSPPPGSDQVVSSR